MRHGSGGGFVARTHECHNTLVRTLAHTVLDKHNYCHLLQTAKGNGREICDYTLCSQPFKNMAHTKLEKD